MEQPTGYLKDVASSVYLAVENVFLERVPLKLGRQGPIFYEGVRCEAHPPDDKYPAGVITLEIPFRRDVFSPGEAVIVIKGVVGRVIRHVQSVSRTHSGFQAGAARTDDYWTFLKKENRDGGISVSLCEPSTYLGELSDVVDSTKGAGKEEGGEEYLTARVRLEFKAVPSGVEKILIQQYVRGGEDRMSARRYFDNKIKGKFVDSKRLEWLCEDGLDREFLLDLVLDGSPFTVDKVMELLKDYKP